jgi:hypothetical protein
VWASKQTRIFFFAKTGNFLPARIRIFRKKTKDIYFPRSRKSPEEKSGAPESACLFVHAQPIGSRVEREWRSPLFAPAFRGIQVITVNNKKEEAV